MTIYITRWIRSDPVEGVNRIFGLNYLMAKDLERSLGNNAKILKYRDSKNSGFKYAIELPSGLFLIVKENDKIKIYLNYPHQQLVYMIETV